MEKTPESVAAEIQALKRSLSEVSTAIDEYAEIATRNVGNKDTKATGEVSESHKGLFLKTHALLATVRGPVDMLISNIENGARHACLRTVLEMGVFPAVPVDGSSITATALAEKLGVQKDLLVRLMRVVTANGPFAEVGKEEYAHTPYSKIYLVPGIANFFRATFDEFAPVNAKMHDYFRATGFKSPTSQRDNPYTYAHQTGGKDIWENLAQFPGRNKAMNDANSDNSEHQSWTIRLFPFESELQKIETTEDTVLLVDIGGGTGAVSKRIRGLTAGIKGKIVLQDRPVVLKGIEEIPGRELMEYDFFTPQPIQGALIYYFRHVLHDWSHDDCVLILKQVAAAMKPGVSRLVISDSILPETKVDIEGAWMDIMMMGVSGGERTQTQWDKVLDEAGFKLHRTYQADGTTYAAIEAYLK